MTVAAPPGHDLTHCIPDLRSKQKEAALAEMVAGAHRAGLVSDPDLLVELLKLRERLGTTAVGKGVALPHAHSLTVNAPRIVAARSPRGIDWNAPDDLPASLVLLVLAPAEWSDQTYHGLLARAAASARLQRTRQKLLAAPWPEGVASVLREALA